jgi:PST family polysaccharide transporter
VNLSVINRSLKANIKVVSTYFHMTALQVMNSFFYLLIYPYVIKSLGVEGFGLFVFATSAAAYFMVFVTFGFDIHAAKEVSVRQEDHRAHGELICVITAAKLLLAALALIVFAVILNLVPFMQQHALLFWVCFANVLSSIFLPVWYFHGQQRMKLVTVVQLLLKLASLPVIFVLVNNEADVLMYASIVVGANVLSALVLFFFAVRATQCQLVWPEWRRITKGLADVQPFFWSTATNTLKQKSVELIIGACFGMREVAIYDLANKIFSVPSLLVSNINAALFPALVRSSTRSLINRIIKIEILLGIVCVGSVAVFGYWIVDFVSHGQMDQAYPLAVLLSLNILTVLIVGSHIYFIYVPRQRYDWVLRNQLVSVAVFYACCGLYLWISWSVYAVVLALSTSALIEIAYSCSLVRKIKDY